MKKLFLLVLPFAVAGCTLTPVNPDTAEPIIPTQASSCPQTTAVSKITVYRDTGFTGNGVDIRVALDGTEVARLKVNQKTTMCVDGSKPHYLNLTQYFRQGVSIPVFEKSNVEHLVRTGFDGGGAVYGMIEESKPLK